MPFESVPGRPRCPYEEKSRRGEGRRIGEPGGRPGTEPHGTSGGGWRDSRGEQGWTGELALVLISRKLPLDSARKGYFWELGRKFGKCKKLSIYLRVWPPRLVFTTPPPTQSCPWSGSFCRESMFWPTKTTRQRLAQAWSHGEGARPKAVQDAACIGGGDQDQRVDTQSFGKTEGVDGTGLRDRREG